MTKDRILFIAPNFYHYHLSVISELESQDYIVDWYRDDIDNFICSSLRRFSPKLPEFIKLIRFRIILFSIRKKNYKYFLMIRGKGFKAKWLASIKSHSPDLYSIMYQWDPNSKYGYFHLTKYFSKVYSFDFLDAKSNEDIEYLPLFYTKDIGKIVFDENILQYDLLFIASFTRERYDFLQKIQVKLAKSDLRIDSHLYIPWTTYLKNKYLKGNSIDARLVSFKKISRTEYLERLRTTKAVVDFTHSQQTGLTMRIVEALSCSKKVYTNNTYLSTEPTVPQEMLVYYGENIDVLFSNVLDSGVGNTDQLSLVQWLGVVLSYEIIN